MSLENLTEREKQALNLGNLMATVLADPSLSRDAKRILKAKNPDLSFPELETEDAIGKVRKEANDRADLLQQELNRRDAIKALEAETSKIEAAGLDAKAVREFMEKKGITDVDVVIELFEQRAQLAEPTADSTGNGPFRFADVTQEELKSMWSNPQKWREEKAHAVIGEMRGQRRRA